ncbi:MAG TPA: hypothetical protein VJZ27_07355, partial [Aggregatilineales bacterium]|nr:hypothetical protein [Aggregatilineales bacterium]
MAGIQSESKLFSQKNIQLFAFLIGLIAIGVLLRRDDCSTTGQSCFRLLQVSLSGILVGGVYALVALGIVIINKASGVFNFAHGMMMLFGGLVFWQTFQGVPSTQLSIILAVLTALIILVFAGSTSQTGLAVRGESRMQRWSRELTSTGFMIALGVAAIAAVIVYALLQQSNYDTTSTIIALLAAVGAGVFLFQLTQTEGFARKSDENLMDWIFRSITHTHFIFAMILVLLTLVFFLLDIPDNIFRGALGSLIVSIALWLAVERFTIRPLLGQPILAAILMTLAIALLLQGSISLIWGSQPRSLPVFVEPAREQKTVVPIGVDPETNETIYQEISTGTIPAQVLLNYKLNTADLLGDDLSFARNL